MFWDRYDDSWKAGCGDNRGDLINKLAETDYHVGVVAKFGMGLLETLDEVDGEVGWFHVYVFRVGYGCAAPKVHLRLLSASRRFMGLGARAVEGRKGFDECGKLIICHREHSFVILPEGNWAGWLGAVHSDLEAGWIVPVSVFRVDSESFVDDGHVVLCIPRWLWMRGPRVGLATERTGWRSPRGTC